MGGGGNRRERYLRQRRRRAVVAETEKKVSSSGAKQGFFLRFLLDLFCFLFLSFRSFYPMAIGLEFFLPENQWAAEQMNRIPKRNETSVPLFGTFVPPPGRSPYALRYVGCLTWNTRNIPGMFVPNNYDETQFNEFIGVYPLFY